MQRKVLFIVVLVGLFAFDVQAQNTSPYWSLAGNSNSNSASKLGTTISEPLNVTTNNKTRVYISSTGQVGVNTTSPATLFHVNGFGAFGNRVTSSNATRALNLVDTAAVMRILRVDASNAPAVELISRTSSGGSNLAYWDMYAQPSDKSFRIRDRVTGSLLDRFTINGSGYVGVGTTSPSTRLQAVATYDGDGISVVGSASGPKDAAFILGDDIGNGGSLGLASANNAFLSGVASGDVVLTSRSGKIDLGTGPATAFPTMTVSGSNVGIGNTAPAAKLHLNVTTGGAYEGLAITNTSSGGKTLAINQGTAGKLNFTNPGVVDLVTMDFITNRVGIGTTTPGYSLDVEGGTSYANNGTSGFGVYGIGTAGVLAVSNYTYGNGVYANATGSVGWGISAHSANAYGIYANTGNSSSYAGYFDGNVYTTGTYYGSDRNLKKDIQDVNSAMDIIGRLQPKTYSFKQDGAYKVMNLPQGKHYGLIAQDVEQVLPELVKETRYENRTMDPQTQKMVEGEKPSTTFKALNYTELIPILVKGMQEQQAQIATKNEKIDQLETRLAKLEAMLIKSNNTTSFSSAYLDNAVPNPSNGLTQIHYSLPGNSSSARLVLANAKGQVLKEITVNGKGPGQTSLNTAGLASGVYTYTLVVNGQQVATKQLVIAR